MLAFMPMWPGNVIRTRFPKNYLEQRDAISNAAYHGIWDEVFGYLEMAAEEYGENWCNVVRLSKRSKPPTRVCVD
jgi:hypothetical protein